jgi:ABC-2 type transport system ATP-binding protein
VLEAKTGSDDGVEELKKVAGVKDVSLTSEGDWQIFSLRVEAGADVRSEVFQLASDRKWVVRELSQRKATLEDVFVEITHPDDA